MRYQLAAENQEEQRALESSPAARVLFDPFLPVLQARALMAAADLGVFEALERKERRASELAEDLSLDAGALNLLLRILVCAGYVSRDDKVYSLTDLSRATLLPRSPMRLASWVRFNYKHWDAIGRMEDVLRTGKEIDPKRFLKSRMDWAIQQEAMLETARPAAPMVAAQIPIREGAEKMLDLGGSHGLYGAEICRLHPPLRSLVIELPEAIDPARDLAHREGIGDLVSHRPGNVLRDDLGRDSCDAVFLGNIVHHFSSDQNQHLFRRISEALRPGGTVAVWDFNYPEPDSPPDLIGDGFALLFRIISGSDCFTAGEISEWIESAGIVEVKIHPTPGTTHMLITGRKA